ncbi:metal-transporting ATPase [Nocardiopsis terrae]|uniref:Heavy metal translocating P-type ATPase n=1 Tax=Nocardiopsis terrae TaxID=372655 RepID=A0ABR9HCV4_9ACTN|nr:heavy metal translocating P-type ATPase [Nocardiopsis terrae]MBE1456868.1 heavy metal translocating P-type ATPase [Nocardiopsis terrae]GHC74703.1 metal-transporting ATPase [Nocardiopsis terrae]
MTTVPTAPTARTRDHLVRPPSLLATGVRLAEVRWAAAALALFLAGWAAQLLDAPAWLWWSLYLTCYATGGWESALSGLRALRERTLDVDLLMIVAAVAAASIGQVFDGALLIVIFATSGALEAVVTQRTADSVNALLNLAPERAVRLHRTPDGEHEEVVETSRLRVGDTVLVRPGERVGADGTVTEGFSEVDQQAITGESVPVPRRVGEGVLSGTINGTGALRVRVDRPAGESVIARIVTLVEEASATKARTQLFIERIEQRYSALVVAATLLVLGIPLLFLGHDFEAALLRAIVFMIVASPCAVVLSTMPPLLASIANAGRHGVLVKSATVMEQIGRVDLVAFDKTGTLTRGEPRVTGVEPEPGHTADQVLAPAAAAECNSEHPLARAIRAHAEHQGVAAPSRVEDFESQPGTGVSATVDGSRVRVERAPADAEGPASTRVLVSVDGRVRGRITLADALRPETARTVAEVGALTAQPVHLLTGDNAATAAHVARAAGVDRVHAGLLPQDKAALVKEKEDAGTRVLLVGDGVNDAPAMAAATTGVAMGRRGSDLALDTADAVVVRDDLSTLPRLITLSRRARRFVVANLCIAGTFIVVLVTWDLVGTLPLALAVAGHEGSTVVVALNGLRLLRERAWTR